MSYTSKGWYYDNKGRTCTICGEYKYWENFPGLSAKRKNHFICRDCLSDKKLTHGMLLHILNYDPATGIFTWKEKLSNRGEIGSEAGCVRRLGYISIGIYGTLYLAHRLAWFYVYGKWPTNNIDHINGNTSDNRINNLRNITQQNNSINTKLSKNNKTGVVGVCYDKCRNKYKATIMKDRKTVNIGRYTTKLEAAKARRKAEIKYGFDKYMYKSTALEYILKHEPDYVDE